MDTGQCTSVDSVDLDDSQNQIMQSQLLSGGLPLQLFPYFFSAEQLANIEKDAAEGVYNADFLIDLRKAMQVRQEDLLTDKPDEEIYHNLRKAGQGTSCIHT